MADEYDRLFNYLSGRVSSRESSAIALLGITASSSLVFLGLVFEKLSTAFWEFFFIGILFPSLAFTYNEITNRGIHKDDQKIINDLIKDTDKEKWEKVIENIVINKKILRAKFRGLEFIVFSF